MGSLLFCPAPNGPSTLTPSSCRVPEQQQEQHCPHALSSSHTKGDTPGVTELPLAQCQGEPSRAHSAVQPPERVARASLLTRALLQPVPCPAAAGSVGEAALRDGWGGMEGEAAEQGWRSPRSQDVPAQPGDRSTSWTRL